MLYGIPIIIIIISFFIGLLGSSRKCGFWGYFFASLLLTPLVGIILVLISAKKNVNNNI